MPRFDIVKTSDVFRSVRVTQMEGMFDVAPELQSTERWSANLPIEDRDWSIGLIVGPSGCGKSTIAKELFGDHLVNGYDWPSDKAILDGFPRDMGIKEITTIMSSVGFSSPPAWLRPFHVLSNGQQFRVTMARALAENKNLVVVDEFTSVVDRTVAQIGSAAIAKAVRKSKKQFVAVSCHYDVLEWLQPDWVFEPSTLNFSWRSLQRRPNIDMEIVKTDKKTWEWFRHHHYLDHSLNPSAQCFVGLVDGQPAAFTAVISFPHPKRSGYREHRTVCLPDFQGVGIGNAMSEAIAAAYLAKGKPYFSTTSSPAMMHYRARSTKWKMLQKPGRHSPSNTSTHPMNKSVASNRITASFEFVGTVNSENAKTLGIV